MKILVAIIAYNEESSIQGVIQDVKNLSNDIDIIVIDDCSIDDTYNKAKKMGVPVLRHSSNLNTLGFTSVQTSFMYAHKNNYDVYCQFDGDGQHNAKNLKDIIKPIRDKEADMVIGSRFLDSAGYKSSTIRRIGIIILSYVVSLFIGQRIFDLTSGFKSYNKKIIEIFATKYPLSIVDSSEIIVVSYYSGSIIKEVPVIMNPRSHGKSSISPYKSVLFPIRAISYIVGVFLQREQYIKYKIK